MESFRPIDPLDPVRQKGFRAKEQLLVAEGGTLSVDEVARLLGTTPKAVGLQRERGKPVGLWLDRGSFAYPAWQFSRNQVIVGLEEALGDLQEFDPWMQVAFMLGANDHLGGETPLTALRRGNVGAVKAAARLFGEHTAT